MGQTKFQLLMVWLLLLLYWENIYLVGSDGLSFTCVHELHLLNEKLIGYPWQIDLLLCRCDCDQGEASKLYFQAHENFREKCENLFEELRGICFPKVQEEMMEQSDSKCYQTGYAYCLFKLSASRTYRELSLRDDENTYIRITIDSNTSVDLPVDAKRFIWNDVVYKIYDGNCDKNLFSTGTYYVEGDGNLNLWKAISTAKLEDENDFLRKNWFVISKGYEKFYQDHVELTDRVCEYDLRADSFVFKAENAKVNEEIGDKQPAKEVVIKENTVEIYDKVLNTEPVDATSKAYFFFSGEIKDGSDGNQYLVISNCSHGRKTLLGSIGIHDRESLKIFPGKEFVMLNKTYYQAQQIGLYPESEKSLKTYTVVAISNETIIIPTTEKPSSSTNGLSILFTNVTFLTTLNSTNPIPRNELFHQLAITIIVIAVVVVPIITIIGVFCWIKKCKKPNVAREDSKQPMKAKKVLCCQSSSTYEEVQLPEVSTQDNVLVAEQEEKIANIPIEDNAGDGTSRDNNGNERDPLLAASHDSLPKESSTSNLPKSTSKHVNANDRSELQNFTENAGAGISLSVTLHNTIITDHSSSNTTKMRDNCRIGNIDQTNVHQSNPESGDHIIPAQRAPIQPEPENDDLLSAKERAQDDHKSDCILN